MERPKSRLAPAMIVAGMLCAILAVYSAGYFLIGQKADAAFNMQPYIHRAFPAEWQARVFLPAAFIEAKSKRCTVSVSANAGSWDAYETLVLWSFDP